MKHKKRKKYQPLHPPKGRKPPPMTKRDQAVWVLLGILAFLGAGGSCWLYRWLRVRWLLAHGAVALHTTVGQLIFGAIIGFSLSCALYGIFAHLYRGQPIWGMPDHHYGRTSIQEEVYPLLGPKREREERRTARKARKARENRELRWLGLAVFLFVLWLFCFCLVPRNRLQADGSVQSARWLSVIPRTYEHSESDTLKLKLSESDRGLVSCRVILTASGEEFEFSPKDFGDADTLAGIAACFPPAEIDRPELLSSCDEEDLAFLAPLLPD